MTAFLLLWLINKNSAYFARIEICHCRCRIWRLLATFVFLLPTKYFLCFSSFSFWTNVLGLACFKAVTHWIWTIGTEMGNIQMQDVWFKPYHIRSDINLRQKWGKTNLLETFVYILSNKVGIEGGSFISSQNSWNCTIIGSGHILGRQWESLRQFYRR